MTQIQLAEMLENIGIEHTYYQYPKGSNVEPPYFAWFLVPGYEYSDDENSISTPMLSIELYTETKDFDLESKLESKFREFEWTWIKGEQGLEDEGLYMVTYEIPIIIEEETDGKN